MLLNYQIMQSDNFLATQTDTIFLIHGLFGSLSNLSLLGKTLKKDHDVILVDLRNHGKSPHSAAMNYPLMSQDIFELADSLHIDTFSILGHSMGGKIAMACALEQPQRIKRIIVADIAPTKYDDRHSNVFKGLNQIELAKINNRQDADIQLSHAVTDLATRQFLLKSLHKNGALFEFRFNLDALEKAYTDICSWPYHDKTYNHPCLFIKGGDSNYIEQKHHQTTVQQFPQAKVKIIPETGHWLHAQKPDLFNRLVNNFFIT